MKPFDIAMAFVLTQEGGMSDDPADPGGITKFGVSHRSYPEVDIANLTEEAAIALYRVDFWDRCSCDQLPAYLAIALMDTAVNQGPSAARRLLQASLAVKQDGVIGPVTIQAAHNADAVEVLAEFIARRSLAYALNPAVTRFGLGWFRRVSELHQLSMEQI